MKSLSMKVPTELDARLARLAARRGASKSAIIREILSEVLAGEYHQIKGSLLECAGELVGCVEGPGDLSTNSAHMKGYGR